MIGPLALAHDDLVVLVVSLAMLGLIAVLLGWVTASVRELAFLVAAIKADRDPPPAMPHAAEAPAAHPKVHAVAGGRE